MCVITSPDYSIYGRCYYSGLRYYSTIVPLYIILTQCLVPGLYSLRTRYKYWYPVWGERLHYSIQKIPNAVGGRGGDRYWYLVPANGIVHTDWSTWGFSIICRLRGCVVRILRRGIQYRLTRKRVENSRHILTQLMYPRPEAAWGLGPLGNQKVSRPRMTR